ncbi:ribosome maturation factor RimM [Alkalibacillus silvisoli]|uniref:Ribosome maturation factor RimM n=1 Tax=Alkalibacillus silvisoli TaxID=392823 RepID=A0ABP3JQK0_9BACI
MNRDYLKVGKIVNTHGVRGEVRVMAVTDFEERFDAGSRLFIENNNSEHIEVEVSSNRKHKQFDLLTLKGYESLEEVEGFKDCLLKVAFEDLYELDEGEFYYFEIIGCEVYLTTGEYLGKVKEILAPGANDVWVVKRTEPGDKDVLIPYIDDVVKEIDIEEQRIVIEEMEGLLS